MCKPIPWGSDEKLLAAWQDGMTGYPFIDALMRQLRQTGWMHHLGRHAVACFLTRGDLWQSWTAGRDVFDKLLLDSDWAVNNGNWLWLAGVAPFSAPYFRVYDPCPGPKSSLNAEQTGEFVRHFVPELKAMPAKYIYKPWTAPLADQKKAGCIVGKDYPAPIVDHASSRDANLIRFKAGLDALKGGVMPEKFGDIKDDPGAMKTTFAKGGKGGKGKGAGKGPSVLDALKSAGSGKGGKRANESGPAEESGGEATSHTVEDSPPKPKRRWQRSLGDDKVKES